MRGQNTTEPISKVDCDKFKWVINSAKNNSLPLLSSIISSSSRKLKLNYKNFLFDVLIHHIVVSKIQNKNSFRRLLFWFFIESFIDAIWRLLFLLLCFSILKLCSQQLRYVLKFVSLATCFIQLCHRGSNVIFFYKD